MCTCIFTATTKYNKNNNFFMIYSVAKVLTVFFSSFAFSRLVFAFCLRNLYSQSTVYVANNKKHYTVLTLERKRQEKV
jgi:hypothetical protein